MEGSHQLEKNIQERLSRAWGMPRGVEDATRFLVLATA